MKLNGGSPKILATQSTLSCNEITMRGIRVKGEVLPLQVPTLSFELNLVANLLAINIHK